MNKLFKIDGIQPIWDKNIINEDKTTAFFMACKPKKIVGDVLKADMPWEDEICYANVVKDVDIYRMYYLTHVVMIEAPECYDENGNKKAQAYILDSYVCYAESKDGLNWVKPELGLCDFEGSKNNNIILRSCDLPKPRDMFDNFFVFIDDNPLCRKGERYKAMVESNAYGVQCLKGYISDDGINFKLKYDFDIDGKFDTLNTCLFDKNINKYVAYVRDFHVDPNFKDVSGVRDIRRVESTDWINWSKAERLDYKGGEEYPLYTNQVMKYYRNENIYVAFPTRYVERQEWTDNYEQLGGKSFRKERMKLENRFGLVVTDGIFMSSRDGKSWDKYDEAIFTAGIEHEHNWVYGDGYPLYFMYETRSDDGIEDEVSMLVRQPAPGWVGIPYDYLTRYAFRKDGFVRCFAPYSGAKVVTKSFVFNGEKFYINFETSARGYVKIIIEDNTGLKAETCELFGDNTNRLVNFEGIDVSQFSGKEVTLTFEMRDASIYSFNFR